MTPAQIAAIANEKEKRRAAARRSFWSDDPLNLTFRRSRGEAFTLREFIAFVIDLPQEQFEACTRRFRMRETDQIADRLLREYFGRDGVK